MAVSSNIVRLRINSHMQDAGIGMQTLAPIQSEEQQRLPAQQGVWLFLLYSLKNNGLGIMLQQRILGDTQNVTVSSSWVLENPFLLHVNNIDLLPNKKRLQRKLL